MSALPLQRPVDGAQDGPVAVLDEDPARALPRSRSGGEPRHIYVKNETRNGRVVRYFLIENGQNLVVFDSFRCVD